MSLIIMMMNETLWLKQNYQVHPIGDGPQDDCDDDDNGDGD